MDTIERGKRVFESPGITVYAAPTGQLLTLKLSAWRDQAVVCVRPPLDGWRANAICIAGKHGHVQRAAAIARGNYDLLRAVLAPQGPRQITFPFWNVIGLGNGRAQSNYVEVILTQAQARHQRSSPVLGRATAHLRYAPAGMWVTTPAA